MNFKANLEMELDSRSGGQEEGPDRKPITEATVVGS